MARVFRRGFPWARVALLLAGLVFLGLGGMLTYISYLRVCAPVVSVRETGDGEVVKVGEDQREFTAGSYTFTAGDIACHHRREDALDLVPELVNRCFKIIAPANVVGGALLVRGAIRRRPDPLLGDEEDDLDQVADDLLDSDEAWEDEVGPPRPGWPAPTP